MAAAYSPRPITIAAAALEGKDVVELEIEGIGVLRNPIVDPD